MAFPTKTQMPVAVKNRSNIRYQQQHVTTGSFMALSIAMAKEMVPNESININHATFSRLEPLSVPTFGRCEIRHHAFFVPFRTVWKGWYDFQNDVPHVYNGGTTSLISSVPTVSNKDLVSFLIGWSELATSEDNYDFAYKRENNGDIVKRNFTAQGRRAYKILRALGYSPIFDLNVVENYSRLPILCLARLYVDWFYTAQYANDSLMSQILSLLDDNSATPYALNATRLTQIFTIIDNLCYDDDMFVNAWDNPSGPNDDLSSNFNIFDIDTVDSSYRQVVANNDFTSNSSDPSIRTTGGTPLTAISQYSLTALQSLSDYLKRNQIAGARVIDRYFAHHGIRLLSEKLNRSVLLENYSQDIKFGDVTSTASTDGAVLGAYAGKGVAYGDGNIELSTDEPGMFIITTAIVPDVMYYQGINRHVKHLSKLDFFTEEFDNLGVQAIGADEVYVPMKSVEGDMSGYPEQVFGFGPRYNEYKRAYNLITGDYILGSRNAGKDSWTLARDVSSYFDTSDPSTFVHSYDFTVSKDKEQFSRIFENINDDDDKFNIIHVFDVQDSFPAKSLYDDYEFENEDDSKKVSVDVGGTQLT